MKQFLILILGLISSQLIASDSIPSFVVKKMEGEIKIDGDLSEPQWSNADYAKDFYEWFPNDTSLAKHPTEIYMFYDDEFLYVGIKCYSSSNNFIINTLRRDYRAGGMDNITLLLDPFNDRTNAFIFGINPLGVVREGLLSNGGQSNDDFNMAWDNKWVGDAQIHDDYWGAEMKIPFKIMTFKEGMKSWGLGSYRFDTQNNEIHTWLNIPRNQRLYSLAFMGEMIWEEPLEKAGKSLAFIPYTAASTQKNFEENTKQNFVDCVSNSNFWQIFQIQNFNLAFEYFYNKL
ncbi:MAG: carbohydrate binding family 9 domain-containing protein, partial [Bacteroidota bacterium]